MRVPQFLEELGIAEASKHANALLDEDFESVESLLDCEMDEEALAQILPPDVSVYIAAALRSFQGGPATTQSSAEPNCRDKAAAFAGQSNGPCPVPPPAELKPQAGQLYPEKCTPDCGDTWQEPGPVRKKRRKAAKTSSVPSPAAPAVGDELLVTFCTDQYPGVVVDDSAIRTTGGKWQPGIRVLNGCTAKRDKGDALQKNEFLVYFEVDGEYWRMNSTRHRDKFTIERRAALSAGSNTKTHNSESSGSDDDQPIKILAGPLHTSPEKVKKRLPSESASHKNNTKRAHRPASALSAGSNTKTHNSESSGSDDDQPIKILAGPLHTSPEKVKKRLPSESASHKNNTKRAHRPASALSAGSNTKTHNSESSGSDDDQPIKILAGPLHTSPEKVKKRLPSESASHKNNTKRAHRPAYDSIEKHSSVVSWPVERAVAMHAPLFSGNKNALARKICHVLRADNSIGDWKHVSEQRIVTAIDGLCIYHGNKRFWMLRESALHYVPKQTQKQFSRKKAIHRSDSDRWIYVPEALEPMASLKPSPDQVDDKLPDYKQKSASLRDKVAEANRLQAELDSEDRAKAVNNGASSTGTSDLPKKKRVTMKVDNGLVRHPVQSSAPTNITCLFRGSATEVLGLTFGTNKLDNRVIISDVTPSSMAAKLTPPPRIGMILTQVQGIDVSKKQPDYILKILRKKQSQRPLSLVFCNSTYQ